MLFAVEGRDSRRLVLCIHDIGPVLLPRYTLDLSMVHIMGGQQQDIAAIAGALKTCLLILTDDMAVALGHAFSASCLLTV